MKNGEEETGRKSSFPNFLKKISEKEPRRRWSEENFEEYANFKFAGISKLQISVDSDRKLLGENPRKILAGDLVHEFVQERLTANIGYRSVAMQWPANPCYSA